VTRLLEKSPDDRPANASSVVDALTAGLSDLEADLDRARAEAEAAPIHVHKQPVIPVGMGSITTGSFAHLGPTSITEPVFVPAPKRQSWLWLVAILAVALVLSTLFGTLLTWWTLPG